jgi:hydroxyacyl-ACP dehydratase HTD2-like protein with hotdog domain
MFSSLRFLQQQQQCGSTAAAVSSQEAVSMHLVVLVVNANATDRRFFILCQKHLCLTYTRDIVFKSKYHSSQQQVHQTQQEH